MLHDLETENLYILTDNDRIIGAVSIVPENEPDGLSCWNIYDGTQKELD